MDGWIITSRAPPSPEKNGFSWAIIAARNAPWTRKNWRRRSLLRKTSALADDAALPGPAIEGAGAIMMRTAGGGKVVAGLIDGKNAPPPGTVDLLSRLGQVDIS